METNNVFLGGTCNTSKWRDKLIPNLSVNYFNPVVDVWDKTAQQNEISQRENAKLILYTITPKFKGLYSIAELVEDSIKRSDKTIFCLLHEDDGILFDEHQVKSLEMIGKMVIKNGAKFFENLKDVAKYINENGK